MSFQYGSDAPEIRNPFRQEGLLYLISGVIIAIIGVISLLTLKGQIEDNGLATGWFGLAVTLILLAGGVHFVTKGIFKMSRFYVGRDVPASLAENRTEGAEATTKASVYYNAQEIAQMIKGRKNLTFREPVTLFDRVLHNIFPNFIFLPIAMRNYLHILVRNTAYSLITLGVYLLALLSGSLGLTLLTTSSMSKWLGILLAVFLFVLWVVTPISAKKINANILYDGQRSQLIWVVVLTILIPAAAELLLRQGITIPEAPFNPAFALVVSYALILLVATAGMTLAKLRSELTKPLTEVSESIDHWQENVHPKDFFRALDLKMTDLRYKEMPNRVYRELNPNLHMEGNMDKGSFDGDTIQETQPVYQDISYPEPLKKIRFGVAVGGHILLIIAAFLLFILNQSRGGSFPISSLFTGIFFPGICFATGLALLTMAHVYWGEMQFKSYLVQFQGEGTYSESKLSVGMSVNDSTQSENTVIRSSFSTWFLASELVTSTQARSGRHALDGPRYILGMHKSDELLNQLVSHVNDYLEEKELIAVSSSEKDGEAMQALYSANKAAPGLNDRQKPTQAELAKGAKQQTADDEPDENS
ncbi:hypothetical protein GCM10028778_07360 [Barrientosiimonas marina]|uniref:PH domain-containing protein n=1 Tax=Lentibacillus kimchii TaxID=1542911 RepID=A0ABW2UY81_9BACI